MQPSSSQLEINLSDWFLAHKLHYWASFIGKSVVLHLLEGSVKGHTTERLRKKDKEDKKVLRDSNPRPLAHESLELQLCYNRLENTFPVSIPRRLKDTRLKFRGPQTSRKLEATLEVGKQDWCLETMRAAFGWRTNGCGGLEVGIAASWLWSPEF